MWKNLPLRHKLSIVIGGALLVSVLISTTISNSAMRSIMTERIEADEIPAILSSLANAIEKEINIPLAISRAMSQNHFTNSWIAQGENPETLNDVSQYLAVMQNQNNAITSFIVSGETGNYYTGKGLSRTLSRESDGWFYSFIDSDKEYSLDVDLDAKLNKLALFINYRTQDKKSVAGIGMDINQVGKLIKGYQIGQEGLVFITNKKGEIQIHPDNNVSSGTLLDDYLKDDVQKTILQKNSQVIHSQGYRDNIVAAKLLPGLNWYVVVEIPTSEVMEPINTSSMYLVLMNILVAAVLIAVGLWVALGVAKPVVRASKMLEGIASGHADLTREMPATSNDEIGTLAKAFNKFVGKLKGIISAVADSATQVNAVSHDLVQAAENTARNMETQQTSVDMVASAITQMGSTVEEIARNANTTADAAKQVVSESEAGKAVMSKSTNDSEELFGKIKKASTVIETLATDVGDISGVLDVIRGISEQTNLLALNAAIEAARAGEQGRGFAVVADEVRTLAQRTQESTEEINTMIQKLQGGAKDAVGAMNSGLETASGSMENAGAASDALNKIIEATYAITDLSIQVATATEEQSSVVDQLNSYILNIKEMSDNTAEQTQKINKQCNELGQSSDELTGLVSNFKL